ncbi:MAG: PAS domain S-box protein [bacterium]|nr:PAS domain S-box protein [bacterium]
MSDKLEELVKERTAELVKANEQLRLEIIERKLTWEALHESENKYKSILETIEEGYFEVDLSGKFIFFNNSVVKLLGYNYDELMKLNYRDYTSKETSKRMYKIFNRIFKTENPEKIMNYEVFTKDGLEKTFELSAALLKDSLNKTIGFNGVLRDVSMRKQAEEEIKKLNRELELRVKERTNELIKTSDALKESIEIIRETQKRLMLSEKMADLGNLVAGATHEINTPLGIAITTASFLNEKTEDVEGLFSENKIKRSNLEEFLKTAGESFEILLANLKRSAELIRSLKVVAVDQCSEEKRTFKVKEYIDEILLSLSPKLKKTKHSITINCPEDLEINSYPGAFFQVISNFVMNSVIHGFDKIEKGEIGIDIKQEDENVIIRYTDNGKGMDEKSLSKIFDQYFTTKRDAGGSGLGMYIVYSLVTETFEGTIECSSHEGQGIEFMITMPSIR